MGYGRALGKLLASPTRPKLGLSRMHELVRRLRDPQRNLRVIHIAGTKGKGSTAAFVDAICRAAGLRTGLTTSPHLSTARERIVTDGEMIGERSFVALAADVESAAAGLECTFFEKMIAMALLHFARERVDVAVVEVGLGGRLDATNVCAPVATAITRLGIDHTEYLGPTLVDIAREKAGIFKPGVPAVSSPQEPDAAATLRACAALAGAPLTFVDIDARLRPSLTGAHQVENASLAAAAVRAAALGVGETAIARGVGRARWPGRYETVAADPVVVLDGAHNEAGGAALAATACADPRLVAFTLVVGMTEGRSPEAFAQSLAALRPQRVVAVPVPSPRSLRPAAVARALARVFGAVDEVGPGRFINENGLLHGRRRAILVCGSLYLVGEVRHALVGGPRDPAFPAF